MRCRFTCDCGAELRVEERTDSIACPQCGSQYAITITKIAGPTSSQRTG